MSPRLFNVLTIAAIILAVFLRVYFIAVVEIEAPIRGDIVDYYSYALNLIDHGTFSLARDGAPITPDAFRSPGYPLFLAAAMLAAPEHWYELALGLQVLLAAITVLLVARVARRLTGPGCAIASALLTALWPHHIAATATLLSEVLFGTMLLAALWSLSRALTSRGAAISGLLLGCASLVNPVSTLLPVAFVAIRFSRGQRRMAAVLLITGLALPAAWSIRNALVVPPSDAPGRITMNLVQGSWPQYHRAHNSARVNETSRQIILAIDAETAELNASPARGLEAIGKRMAQDPGYYFAWYAWQKPYLLWDWDVRIGAGDVYYHKLEHSPLESHPVLAPVKNALHLLNPAFFGLALLFIALVGFAAKQQRYAAEDRTHAMAIDLAMALLYLTVVHWVLQAEPRYAIAYRPMEIVAAVAGAAMAWQRLARRRDATRIEK